MATKKTNKNTFLIMIVALLFGMIGGSLAYFTTTTTVTNTFQTQPYSTEVTDTFTSPEIWIPGTITPKTVVAKNTGDVDVKVRLSYTEKWTSASGKDLSLTLENGERVSILTLINTDDWEYRDGYYYYVNTLSKNETTTSFIESVTFNPNAVNDYTCSTNEGVTSCTSTRDGYDGATYELNIKIETVQEDAASTLWQ